MKRFRSYLAWNMRFSFVKAALNLCIANLFFYKEYIIGAVFALLEVEKIFVFNKNTYDCKRHFNGTQVLNFKFLWLKLWPSKLEQTNRLTDGQKHENWRIYLRDVTEWSFLYAWSIVFQQISIQLLFYYLFFFIFLIICFSSEVLSFGLINAFSR